MPSGKGARERRREARMELQRQYAMENDLPMPEFLVSQSPCPSEPPDSPVQTHMDSSSNQTFANSSVVQVPTMSGETTHRRIQKATSMPFMGSNGRSDDSENLMQNNAPKQNVKRNSVTRSNSGIVISDTGAASDNKAPRRRVAASWIEGNLKSMVRPARIFAPSPTMQNGPCYSPGHSVTSPGQRSPAMGVSRGPSTPLCPDIEDEPSGLQDDEISELEDLLCMIESKERELDGLHFELHQVLNDPAVLGSGTEGDDVCQKDDAAKRDGLCASYVAPQGHDAKPLQPPQNTRVSGPANSQSADDNGPRGVCESPCGSEGQEEQQMPRPPLSPDQMLVAGAGQHSMRKVVAGRAVDMKGLTPLVGGIQGLKGRKNKNWKNLFPSRVRKLEKELKNLDEEDGTLDELQAELRASVPSS